MAWTRRNDCVIDVRNIGLVEAIELKPWEGQPGARAFEVYLKAFEVGLLIRATGDIIAQSPPLIITEQQIDMMVNILDDILSSI